MEASLTCPACHAEVRPTDYYCYNCGKSLKEKPPSTALSTQVGLYLLSFFLPPFGLLRGLKYLKQPDQASKTIGIMTVVLTIVSIIITAVLVINTMNTVNTQVNEQLQNFGGF